MELFSDNTYGGPPALLELLTTHFSPVDAAVESIMLILFFIYNRAIYYISPDVYARINYMLVKKLEMEFKKQYNIEKIK